MRTSTAAAMLCLAAGIASSSALPAIVSERAESPTNKAIAHEFVKALTSAVFATGVVSMFDIYSKPSSRRELFQRFQERIDHELAIRAHKRELRATSLNDLD